MKALILEDVARLEVKGIPAPARAGSCSFTISKLQKAVRVGATGGEFIKGA